MSSEEVKKEKKEKKEKKAKQTEEVTKSPSSPAQEEPDEVETNTSSIVKLNIGGHFFQTTSATLARKKKNLFSAILAGKVPVVKDEHGAIFIDRDGKYFEPILDFLRTGELRISTALESQSDAIYLEADYYQINLPKRKIFDKEAEYHTESVALPSSVKPHELQQEINAKEAEGYTYVNSISTKNNVFLFFKK